MADNSFGIKELNLIGSGTPKIESPNNINLDAVNVAISTNATVGGTLDVDGHTELDGVNVSGVCTATSFEGGGNDIVTSRWDVVGGGTYAFTGPGGLNGASQPKIYLARGQTYEFVISNASSHPFQIQQSNGTVYNTGVTNNGSSVNGVVVKFEVPFSAPNSLQYVCTVHGGMGNTIIVYPDLSP